MGYGAVVTIASVTPCQTPLQIYLVKEFDTGNSFRLYNYYNYKNQSWKLKSKK